MKSLLIVYSYHHNNTQKIAEVFAQVLDAKILNPQEVNLEKLPEYDLIGFGSGIYSAKHHRTVLDMIDKLPHVTDSKSFIFSTAALTSKKKLIKDHSTLREKLQSKGYDVVDDFQCKGFNTNSFMKYLGGMNKGRPSPEDFQHAKEFAEKLKQKLQQMLTERIVTQRISSEVEVR